MVMLSLISSGMDSKKVRDEAITTLLAGLTLRRAEMRRQVRKNASDPSKLLRGLWGHLCLPKLIPVRAAAGSARVSVRMENTATFVGVRPTRRSEEIRVKRGARRTSPLSGFWQVWTGARS